MKLLTVSLLPFLFVATISLAADAPALPPKAALEAITATICSAHQGAGVG
jgi:hypothetical protein